MAKWEVRVSASYSGTTEIEAETEEAAWELAESNAEEIWDMAVEEGARAEGSDIEIEYINPAREETV